MAQETKFYGWRMTVVCLLVQAIAGGITIYLYSMFAGEVEKAFDAKRATVMLAATGHAVVSALVGPKLGALMDAHRLRWTMIACAAAMGGGFMLAPLVPSVWGFVAGFTLLVAVGSAGLTTLFTPLLLARWFVRRRGLAMGIAALGSQLGGFVLPPAVAFLIGRVGWQAAMFLVGLFAMASISALVYWAVIDHPHDCGQHPDGIAGTGTDDGAEAAASLDASLWAVLRDRNFWVAATGIGLVIAVFSAVLTNLSIFATDLGESLERGAKLLSLFAFVGIVTSPLIGRLCDVLDIRIVFAGVVGTSLLALLLYATASDYQGLLVATAILAAVGGGVTPFIGALVGRLFDLRVYGRATGSLFLVAIGVSSLVPVLSGWLYDFAGNYRAMFQALSVALLLPLVAVPFIRLRPGCSPSPAR